MTDHLKNSISLKSLIKNQNFQGIFGVTSLSVLFILIYFLEKNNFIPFLPMISSEPFNPIRFFTSNFYHNDQIHLIYDVIALIFLGFPFFYKYELKNGFLFYFLIGFIGNILSSIIFLGLSLILFQYGSDKLIYITGTGSSGATAGIGIITIFLLINLVKQKKIEEFIKKYSKDGKFKRSDNIILIIFGLIIILLIYILVSTILIDLYLVSSLLQGKFLILEIQTGKLYGLSKGLLNLLEYWYKNNQGTPYLIHTSCILIGILYYFSNTKRNIKE